MRHSIYFFLTFILLFQSCGTKKDDCNTAAGRFIYKITREFAHKLEPEGLSLCGMGRAINHANLKTKSIGIDFQINEILTVEKARELIVQYVPLYLAALNADEELADCLDEVPFPMRRLSFAIDGKMLSPDDCQHVASVACYGEKIVYYSNDPDIKVEKFFRLHEETFEEAEHIVAAQSKSTQAEQEVPGVVEG